LNNLGKIKTLENCRMFRHVDSQVIESVASKLIGRTLEKGEFVFLTGNKPEGIFIIEQGKICFKIPDAAGRDHFIDFASDGHFFGENELLGRYNYFSDAVAMERTVLWFLAKADFESLFYGVPSISQNIAKLLVQNIRLFHQAKYDAQKRSLNYRLVNLLLILWARFHEKTEEGDRIAMHLPHEELAFMVSATRQSVTKILNEWQDMGWITYKYGKIILIDRTALEHYRAGCEE